MRLTPASPGRRRVFAAAALFAVLGGALAPAGASVAVEADDFFSVTTTAVTDSFTNLAPGDEVSWFVTLTNTATFDMPARLSLASTTLGRLMTDAEHGLHAQLLHCSLDWTAARLPVCAGDQMTILDGPLAVIQGGYDLPVLGAQSTAHYLVQIEFPFEATNIFQNRQDDLDFMVVVGDPSSRQPPASTGDNAGLLGRLAQAGTTLVPLGLGAGLVVAGAIVVGRSRLRLRQRF
ncbi:hypothetical protein D6T64_18230 [Cryobacterium melibiosiphilum]|uniref:LPXTG cell wall anchor domain-containing protein n=1 Tax=Cryobacterium melibiosiphilum TaxID=995039 RepID=A0A3A5ML33_9MICO|nr:hypothetical protein [Cryobacterium melibiosiphilum]RJT86204.1 hypothetical protein D6T64_18230 [Cryobacterium melibiosiphilum]